MMPVLAVISSGLPMRPAIVASLAHLSEEDIGFIAQAIASGATHLLTSDKDLLALWEAGLPFAIVTPAELAALLGLGEG